MAIFASATVHSETIPTNAPEMYERAELVVVGKVLRIDETPLSEPNPDVPADLVKVARLAVFQVRETWKGKKEKELTFRAYPTWMCDTSTAVRGEELLLFLAKEKKTWAIFNSGAGRFEITSHKLGKPAINLSRIHLLRNGWQRLADRSSVDISLKRFKKFLASKDESIAPDSGQ